MAVGQEDLGPEPARSPSFCLAKVGLYLQPLCRNRGGGVSRDPDRMEGPSFSVGCPLGKATRGRARCPCSLPSGRVSRSRAGPRAPGWPPGDTGAAGARCTHLASLLSRRAFFARVPLSGERRPALARGQNRPPDAHPPSSLRSENGSWGSSRLLPPHENKMGRAGDARQLSRLGQAQTGGLIHPLVPDPQLLHLKSGNNARPGQWPELPMEGGGGGVLARL